MAADPKARRVATEFFGQWLGFYHFDQHKGVDTSRFPEFTDEVRDSMYDEAVVVLRAHRPQGPSGARDPDRRLHLPQPAPGEVLRREEGGASQERPGVGGGRDAMNRGGLLRLGAVLTATSAPLRTSPVKRGDWVLRRILGTATPPPPADAGSLPPDDKMFGGLTLQAEARAAQAERHLRELSPADRPAGFRVRALRFDRPVAREVRRRQGGRGLGGDGRQDRDRRYRRAAEVPHGARRPGAQDALAEVDGVRAGPHRPALRPAAGREAGGGGRQRDVLAARRGDRDEQTVPEPVGTGTAPAATVAVAKVSEKAGASR